MSDPLGGHFGVGCVLCPMTDNRDESNRRWTSPERGVISGTPAVVVFKGMSLCYGHFLQQKREEAAEKP